MRRRGIPPGALARALEKAKSLTLDHRDPAVSAGARVREIAKKLDVTRVEGGALDADGFLSREADGTFAVYYDSSDMPERREFTVAHELAHIILDKYHKHLGTNEGQSPL